MRKRQNHGKHCGKGSIWIGTWSRLKPRGMIEFAKKFYQPFYKNIAFIHDDILEFSPSAKFDLIFSSSTLHWILDHERFLCKVHDLLHEQGAILFTIPCSPISEVQDPWRTYLKDYYHPRRKFTAEEYALLLEQADFNEIETAQIPFTYYFETKREFADWYAAFSPMLFYIPEELKEMLLTIIVERYLQSFPLDETGRVVFK